MSARRPLVLVVDDEPGIRASLQTMLRLEGMDVVTGGDGREAVALAAARRPQAVLLDLQMPVLDGMGALSELRQRHPALPVIILTAHGSVGAAVKAVRAGAFDFLEKPPARERILAALRAALREPPPFSGLEDTLIGRSAAMNSLREKIARVAPKDATVLVTGENGTGKELVAEAIHRGSARSAGPSVKVNCAALPEALFESELFGHEKGAFTGAVERRIGRFERASGGTLFLDEIGELTPRLQAKLLRALQEGGIERVGGREEVPVDVRVIAATNRNLEAAVRDGLFREDLYYRLNVIPIEVPPLRERSEDIPVLAERFFADLGQEHGAPGKGFDATALARLSTWPFPGNVRELRNLVERCVILCPPALVTESHLREVMPSLFRPSRLPASAPLRDRLAESEREMILEVLERTRWKMSVAARMLGLERSHLYKRLRALGIDRPRATGEGED